MASLADYVASLFTGQQLPLDDPDLTARYNAITIRPGGAETSQPSPSAPSGSEQQLAADAREAAAARLRGAVRPTGGRKEGLPGAIAGLFQSDYPMEPDLAGVQSGSGASNIPQGYRVNDAGEVYNEQTGEVLPVTRRPGVLPFTRDPSGKIVAAMPKALDILGNISGGVVAPATGGVVLGAGPVRRGAAAAKGKKTTGDVAADMTALPENWRDLPGQNAPYAQYAEQYPSVGPPQVLPKDKPKFPGETYEAKLETPEAEAFMAQRAKIAADMKKRGYEKYFDPAKRFHVDPSNYPGPNVEVRNVAPKRLDTLAEYLTTINAPETAQRLRDAYKRGQELGNADNWYAMGQLEAEYIKELGPKAGRKAFLDEFAVPMAATTSGQQPGPNFLMAHYFEMLRKRGEALPPTHQLPSPVGGRRPKANVRDYEGMRERGGYEGLGADQPKMHAFSRSFIGDLSRGVMDENMAAGMLKGAAKDFIDKARTTGFGLLERVLSKVAKQEGLAPGNLQDVAWAGIRNKPGQPMIDVINDVIERTHRLTGMPRSEIVRRGIIKKEIPLYSAGGASPSQLSDLIVQSMQEQETQR